MRYFLFVVLICCTSVSSAQNRLISGMVSDSSGTVIADATVSLLKAVDSSWLQSVLTDANGKFVFQSSISANFLINIDAPGYERKQLLLTQLTDIHVIMVPLSGELKEVVIKGNAPAIKTDLGKTIVNFEQTTVSGVDNVLDLLRRAPGVMVDGSGNISMNGKGVLVTINDKQSYLSGDDLINFLKNIAAEQVAQLELMNQPSAKYDAAGNNGIINIKTKKTKQSGISGNLSLSYGQGVYANTHNNGSVNYKKDKLSMSVIAGYLRATGFLNEEQYRTTRDDNGSITTENGQKSFLKETFEDYNMTVSGDYDATERLSFSGSIGAIYHPNSEKDVTHGTLNDLENKLSQHNTSVNERGLLRKYLGANVSGTYKPLPNHSISLAANSFIWSQKNRQDLYSSNYDEQNRQLNNGLQFRSTAPRTIQVAIIKGDYEGTILQDIKVEAGLKSSWLNNDNTPDFYVYRNNEWLYDSSRSNKFHYNERITAAYVSAGKNWNKWQLKLGLRAEQTTIAGLQEVKNQQFNRSFISVFPTVFLGYKLNEQHSFEVNLGRRIERPSYRDLNPFISYLSQYTASSGNPDLLPQFRNSLSLRHNYKNMLFSEVSFGKVTNMINPAINYDEATKLVLETLRNYAVKYNLHAGVNFNKALNSWWNFSSSYDYYFNEYKDDDGQFLASSIGQSAGMSHEFNYKGWTVLMFYQYNSGDLQSLTERSSESQWMNASFAKKFWSDTAVVKLSLNDPFAIYRYKSNNVWNGVATNSTRQFATQSADLTFSYKFGEHKNIKQREAKNEEERRL